MEASLLHRGRPCFARRRLRLDDGVDCLCEVPAGDVFCGRPRVDPRGGELPALDDGVAVARG